MKVIGKIIGAIAEVSVNVFFECLTNLSADFWNGPGDKKEMTSTGHGSFEPKKETEAVGDYNIDMQDN